MDTFIFYYYTSTSVAFLLHFIAYMSIVQA